MQIFVQTRGAARASDYCFLGQAPHSPWWRVYREHTAFDHPTLIVHSDGAEWRAYLSGIPSARVDAVGTVIRYTVALEGVCGGTEAAAGTRALAIIAAWLSDIATSAAGGGVQSVFDREFPGPVVERLLADGRDGAWKETRQRAMAALTSLPAAHPVATAGPGSWIGDVAARVPRTAFLGRAAGLLTGTAGRAVFLNLIGSREDGAALVQDGPPVAILGEDVMGIPSDEVAELPEKKAPPLPRSTTQAARRRTTPPTTTRRTTPPATMPRTRRRPSLLRWLAALLGGGGRWSR
ncbi:MAG: hypothetical protein ACRDSP_03915 [Pseudonocardiaceae bacterium]